MRFLTTVLAALAIGCNTPITAPPPPPPPVVTNYVRVADYPTPDSALQVVRNGGTMDFGGQGGLVALKIPVSTTQPGQSWNVTITNCGAGLQSPDARPVISATPGVSVYAFRLSKCLVMGNSPVLIDFTNFFSSSFEDVRWFCGPSQVAFSAIGRAYYNWFVRGYGGCGTGIKVSATAGASSGPNSNHVLGTRFNGVGTGIDIGEWVQDWTVDGAAFETCTISCMKIDGTRIAISGQNRFECAAPVGIDLLPHSDGWIVPQYWSSCGVRIRFSGADPLNWIISPQPGQQ